ncbi:hypothetical protein DSL72_005004 [Monilinia vaccinii-corymbosi]|uniref:Uncharacterized protein n=1 Tax=Monilinia vaccinii-corymbosi TaxID=61207 RepID=A0A8A3PEG5_9HELO|nr:hypothetical protein DSL72_005004 [Monilinia vaccinii-corymbosi]
MQTSSRKQASGTESEVEDEIVIDEEERQYRLEIGRRMKRKNPGLLGPTIDEFGGVFMGISQARVDDGRGTTRRSIPQMDGPGSPKLLAVDAPVERSWSPSPRKKLQKVNRSKSPNSMKKSSSSSLGRVFQKSKVEGLEGEVRDLRTEVGGLKRLVESLEKELRRVEFQGAKGCEIVGNMREKTKEMWRTVYGKGWDGEKVGEEGQDWKDLEEVEYTKKVRDLGLLRVMGRLEMKVDKQREEMHQVEDGVFRRERGIETYDMDLMLPHPIQPGFKGGDTGRNYGKIEGRRFMSTDTSNSSERSESRESAVGGGRKRNNSIIERHLDSMALVFSESLKHEGQLLKLKGGGLDLEREDKMLGDDGYQSGCRFGDMVKGTEALDMELDREDDAKKAKEELFPPQDVIRDFAELPYFGMEGIESSASRMQLWGMIKRNRIKRGIEEMGLVDGSRKVGPVLGGLVEEEEDGEGEFDESELRLLGGVFDDDEDGLGVELGSAVGELLEKKSDGVIGSWKPDVDEMTELIEAEGIYSPALLLGGGGEKNKEKEKEKERRLKDFIRSVLEEQEVERARREEWWEIERTRDLDEVRRLGGELSELKGLILRGLGDSRGICGGGGIGGAVCGGGGNAGGGPGGRASNVANMRERDVCGDGDGDEDCGGSGSGSGNGKGFWDWVGGGILWRQD